MAPIIEHLGRETATTTRSWLWIFVFAAGCPVFGCGDGLSLAEVAGRVTSGGQPVTSGVIMFHPDSGPTAVGTILADGTYTLTTVKANDGAIVGRHHVTITATHVGEGKLVEAKTADEELKMAQQRPVGRKVLVPGQVTWLVPEKYSRLESTDLLATVKAGKNTIDFTIP